MMVVKFMDRKRRKTFLKIQPHPSLLRTSVQEAQCFRGLALRVGDLSLTSS